MAAVRGVGMNKLNEYYQNRQSACNALDRYLKFTNDNYWDIGGQCGKLHLYKLASRAFDSRTPRSDALEAFCKVYDTVKKWPGVQRGGSLAPADEVFDVLLRDGSSFLYGTKVSLVNLTFSSSEASGLEEFLPSLKFVKPTRNYPWMPVSKVLHFANPGLFPMWDRKVLWNEVMGGTHAAFHTEYKTFCRKHGFAAWENGARFVLNYTLWAAHYIQQSNSEFMEWFVDWIDRNFSDDLAKYSIGQRIHTFYATAFEFVAIGAAYLDR
jgi:hypothetical protein